MDIKIEETEKKENIKNNKIIRIIKIISLIILAIVLFIVYARFKATTGLKIKEYKITNDKIPENFHGTKLVQISDIHYGNTVDIKYLKTIVTEINKLKPDILILTGDLLDKKINEEEKKEIINTLKEIKVSIDKYAIIGDKDYDTNLWKEIITQSNFIDLNNQEKHIYQKTNKSIIISNTDIKHEKTYAIYVTHEPDKIDKITNKFDLILAGHSLNGQINIPIIKKLLLQDGAKKYYKNHYIINNTDMYISSGIGTTSFKYRLFNKPSINLYRLTKY
jgi:hypothetical protein